MDAKLSRKRGSEAAFSEYGSSSYDDESSAASSDSSSSSSSYAAKSAFYNPDEESSSSDDHIDTRTASKRHHGSQSVYDDEEEGRSIEVDPMRATQSMEDMMEAQKNSRVMTTSASYKFEEEDRTKDDSADSESESGGGGGGAAKASKYAIFPVSKNSRFLVVSGKNGKPVNYTPRYLLTNASGGAVVKGDGYINSSGGTNASAPANLNSAFNANPYNMMDTPKWQQQVMNLMPFYGPFNGEKGGDPFLAQRRNDFALPEAYLGDNTYNRDVLLNEVLSSNSVVLTSVLPLQHSDNLGQEVMEVLTFDRGLMAPVPWESVGRMMRSTKETKTFQARRHGLMHMNEYNFFKSERGRAMHILQLKQMATAAVDTLKLAAITALTNTLQDIDMPSARSILGVGDLPIADYKDMLGRAFDDWAIIQKQKDGLDASVQGGFDRARARGIDPSSKNWSYLLPTGAQLYVVRQPDHRDFALTGKPRETFDLEENLKIRGMKNAIEIQPFPANAGEEFINPMYTISETGGHIPFSGKPSTVEDASYKTKHCDVDVFVHKDSGYWQTVPYKEVLQHSFLCSDGWVEPDLTLSNMGVQSRAEKLKAKKKEHSATDRVALEKTRIANLVASARSDNAHLARLAALVHTDDHKKYVSVAAENHAITAAATLQVVKASSYDHAKKNATDTKTERGFLSWYVRELSRRVTRKENADHGTHLDESAELAPTSIGAFYRNSKLFGENVGDANFKIVKDALQRRLGSAASSTDPKSEYTKLLNFYGCADVVTAVLKVFTNLAAAGAHGGGGQAAIDKAQAAVGSDAEWLLDQLPFDSRWIAYACQNDVPVLIPAIYCRPHIRWQAGMTILTVTGLETGTVKAGNARAMVGDIASAQIHTMSYTMTFAAIVYQDKNVIQNRCAFIRGCKGGGGLSFYKAVDQKAYIAGKHMKDVFVRALFPGELDAAGWDRIQDMAGFHNGQYTRDDSILHSTFYWYTQFWQSHHSTVDHIRSPIVGLHRFSNTLVPQERHRVYDDAEKKNCTYAPGVGWTGNWLREGVLKVFTSYGKYLDPDNGSTSEIRYKTAS